MAIHLKASGYCGAIECLLRTLDNPSVFLDVIVPRTLLYVPGRLGESWTGCRHGGDDVGFLIELELG